MIPKISVLEELLEELEDNRRRYASLQMCPRYMQKILVDKCTDRIEVLQECIALLTGENSPFALERRWENAGHFAGVELRVEIRTNQAQQNRAAQLAYQVRDSIKKRNRRQKLHGDPQDNYSVSLLVESTT